MQARPSRSWVGLESSPRTCGARSSLGENNALTEGLRKLCAKLSDATFPGQLYSADEDAALLWGEGARIVTAALVVSLARLAKRRNTRSLAAVGLVSGLFKTASARDRYINSMLTYLRYAVAIVCFALSVGSWSLWWVTIANETWLLVLTQSASSPPMQLRFLEGYAGIVIEPLTVSPPWPNG